MVKGWLNLIDIKKGKTVDKNLKGYSTLSILEKGIYTNKPYYAAKHSSHSIMEIKVYNTTVHERMGLWQRIQMKISNILNL